MVSHDVPSLKLPPTSTHSAWVMLEHPPSGAQQAPTGAAHKLTKQVEPSPL
jgi:hypothetical protein